MVREVPKRFLVAISFSGAERKFVHAIAEAVERRLGASSVFFYEWFEFYISGHDADVKLQHIYGAGCELAVVCVSATYGSRAWTRAEHEAIRARLMKARGDNDSRQRDRVFPIRIGDGDVDGIPFNALVPDVRGRTPDQVAELIVDRLQFVTGGTVVAAAAVGAEPTAVAAAQNLSVRREEETEALAKQLDDAYARQKRLEEVGEPSTEATHDILDLKRRLREGGHLRAGDRLGSDGRYQLIQQVGGGGFAVVWKAKDTRDGIYVAIKVLHANLSGDSQRRERFFRGARMMQKLDHPAVVRVLDPRCEDGGFWYFVMELLPGGNLHNAVLTQLVTRNETLPLILQIGEALALAHAKNMIHRDIKPANILLDERGNAKLTDFDLVRAHDTTAGTRTGALGTAVYAAPECLHKPQDATARADVWGLGMTAIFCLAGQDLSMDTFVNRAETLSQLDCTESVRKVLDRAVEWKPGRRFANAAEMVGALRDALGSSAQSVVVDNGHSARTQPVVQTPSMSVAVSLLAGQQQTNHDEAGHSSPTGAQVAVEATRAEAASASRKRGGAQAAGFTREPTGFERDSEGGAVIFQRSSGFVRVLQLLEYLRLPDEQEEPGAVHGLGQDVRLKALHELESYFRTPSVHPSEGKVLEPSVVGARQATFNEEMAAFKLYRDVLWDHIPYEKYAPYATRVLLQLGVLSPDDDSLHSLIARHPMVLRGVLDWCFSARNRDRGEWSLKAVYMQCLRSVQDPLEPLFYEEVIRTGAKMKYQAAGPCISTTGRHGVREYMISVADGPYELYVIYYGILMNRENQNSEQKLNQSINLAASDHSERELDDS